MLDNSNLSKFNQLSNRRKKSVFKNTTPLLVSFITMKNEE